MRQRYIARIIAALFLTGVLLAPAVARWQFPAVLRLWHDSGARRLQAADTEFVLARVRYTPRHDTGHGDFYGRESWAHTYPQAEEHILQLAAEVSGVSLSRMSHVVVRLDSPDLFHYPFAYMTEPGEMNMTAPEVTNLREYLDRGGFIMVDDFNTQESLDWFTSQMRLVFPDRRFMELKANHPIFHTFYDTPTVAVVPPYRHAGGGSPKFYGYYDEHGRLCMIINHDNNIGAFWVWLDQTAHPLSASAEAARFGLNYFLYSLTH